MVKEDLDIWGLEKIQEVQCFLTDVIVAGGKKEYKKKRVSED